MKINTNIIFAVLVIGGVAVAMISDCLVTKCWKDTCDKKSSNCQSNSFL